MHPEVEKLVEENINAIYLHIQLFISAFNLDRATFTIIREEDKEGYTIAFNQYATLYGEQETTEHHARDYK